MRDLHDLVAWLDYGRRSGYIAAREPKEQEEHWALELRKLIASHERLLAQCKSVVEWGNRTGGFCESEDEKLLETLKDTIADTEGEEQVP